MIKTHCWRILHALTSVVAVAAPLRAQTTVNVGPSFGYYRPFGHFDPASVYSTSLPTTPSDLRGFAWGGAAQITFGQRLGAEAKVSVANSTIHGGNTPAGPRGPTSAHVVAVTLQAQYEVSPTPETYRVWLSAGPGLIRHGGDAYAPYGSPTSVSGALGVGISLPIGFHLQIAADATTLLYSFDVKMPPELQGNPGSLQHGTQADALVHVDVRWGLP